MTRATCLVLLGWVAGCHPPEAATPTPTPRVSKSATESRAKPLVATSDAPPLAALPDMPTSSSGSPCERSCAELHSCVITQGEPAAAAASIELGCLAACVHNPGPNPASTLFGCELPSGSSGSSGSPGSDRCDPFLDCVRGAWPEQARALTPLGPTPATKGCERACWAFARCEGKAQTDDDRDRIVQCVQKCGDILDDEQERIVGECASLPDCQDIEHCVLSTPGA